jgi:acyl-CoA synthetase (AMP-forming)/AMP-acid ligase II
MNDTLWITKQLEEYSDRKAIVYNDNEFTYSKIYSIFEEWREYLQKKGINSGDTVAIKSGFSPQSISLLLALADRKNIAVPISTESDSEVNKRVNESSASHILTIDGDSVDYQSTDHTGSEDTLLKDLKKNKKPGLVLFSSGSTGEPKAMVHDLDRLISSYKGKSTKSLRILVFLMFDHIGGINTLFNAVATGLTMVLPQNRDATYVASLIEKHGVNILPASPTFLNLLLMSNAHRDYDLSSLRLITYGTEPMPDSLLTRLHEQFPRAKFVQTFGTSETGINKTKSKSSDSTYMKLAEGDIEHKIVDGELWLRSDTQIEGYINRSNENFTEDGWFKTGDIVEEDDDGYIKIVGRSKEVINVGGEKVKPTEVESEVMKMDKVDDCLAYGEDNPITGEVVNIDVVWSDSNDKGDIRKEIKQFCNDKMPKHKIPAKINLVEEVKYNDRFKKVRK